MSSPFCRSTKGRRICEAGIARARCPANPPFVAGPFSKRLFYFPKWGVKLLKKRALHYLILVALVVVVNFFYPPPAPRLPHRHPGGGERPWT